MDSDNQPSREFVQKEIAEKWARIHEIEIRVNSYGRVQAFGYPSLDFALCVNASLLEIRGSGASRQVRLARSNSVAASSSQMADPAPDERSRFTQQVEYIIRDTLEKNALTLNPSVLYDRFVQVFGPKIFKPPHKPFI